MIYNRFMAKIFVCGKTESLEAALTTVCKEFPDVVVEYLSGCEDRPFLGISLKDSMGPKVFFYGNPKFDALMESVRIFNKGSFEISNRVAGFIEMIDKEVVIKVFVTQSCGWCFPAIIKAVGFAYLSSNIKVEVFDCYSFPQLANFYNVVTVPKTVINDKVEFVGTKDDNEFFGYIIKAIEE